MLTSMSGWTNSDIFSVIRSWKYGWNLYTDPSMPTVTDFSSILFISVAMPADTKCAARRLTHSHT